MRNAATDCLFAIARRLGVAAVRACGGGFVGLGAARSSSSLVAGREAASCFGLFAGSEAEAVDLSDAGRVRPRGQETSGRFAGRASLSVLVAGGVLLFLSVAASADVLKFARFHLLGGKSPNTYELDVQLPVVLTAAPGEEVVLPEGCKITSQNAQVIAGETSAVLKFACDEPVSEGATIRVPWGEDGGVFTSSLMPDGATPRMIHGDEEGLALPLAQTREDRRSLVAVAAEYTGLGVIHILEGLDHLAFVLCLCLLTRGVTLLLLVTAFTLGHSISLALSFLGILTIPVPPVEATIALSIAFMAREALLARRGESDGRRARLRYMSVVAAFGLLHGLGFASVLGDLGVAPAERIAGLIFFNVGVELGQLAFVGAVTAFLWLASKLRFEAPLRTAALYGVGIVGVFWTCERVAGYVV